MLLISRDSQMSVIETPDHERLEKVKRALYGARRKEVEVESEAYCGRDISKVWKVLITSVSVSHH